MFYWTKTSPSTSVIFQPNQAVLAFKKNFIPGVMHVELVTKLQELAESEPKDCPKHQGERWTNIS